MYASNFKTPDYFDLNLRIIARNSKSALCGQLLRSSQAEILAGSTCKNKERRFHLHLTASVEQQAKCFSVDLHPDFNLRPFDCRKLARAGAISVTDSFFTSIYILAQEGRKGH